MTSSLLIGGASCDSPSIGVTWIGGTQVSNTTITLATNKTISAGSLIVVTSTNANGGRSMATASDAINGSYALALTSNTGPVTNVAYFANSQAIPLGTNITVTTNSTSATTRCLAWAITGIVAVSPLDVAPAFTNGASGTASTAIATGTLAQAKEIILGFVAINSNSTVWAPAAGFTTPAGFSAVGVSVYMAYKLVNATTTSNFSSTWATPSGSIWGSSLVSFKGA